VSSPDYRVLFSQRFLDDETRSFLKSANIAVDEIDLPAGMTDADLPREELVRHLDGAAGWIVGHVRIDRTLLSLIPTVRVIARRGVGYEKIDVAAAHELGKVVTIARGGNEETVADHTIGLMLAVGRQLRTSHEAMQSGDWSIRLGTDLFRKTVGVVGFGSIGRAVVRRLKGFETRILVYTPRMPAASALMQDVEFVDLETLLRQSDYVTLHAPLTPDTKEIINGAALKIIKPGAILINTARAGLVDENVLLVALQSGKIKGVGLDVLAAEAEPAHKALADTFLANPHVVISPHAAGSTIEALARTNLIAARTIVEVLSGNTPAVSFLVTDGRRH
jgi:D-3-phosphoglycerate dehydrogenase